MKLDSRDIFEILTTVKELGFRRFHVQVGDLTLEVDTDEGAAPGFGLASDDDRTPVPKRTGRPESPVRPSSVPGPAPAHGNMSVAPSEGVVAVTAPMSGIFYRSPAPGATPFVEVGSRVEPNDTVCIVEIMKLFNSIVAGVAGTVVEILVENEGRVEADQPMMRIEAEDGRG